MKTLSISTFQNARAIGVFNPYARPFDSKCVRLNGYPNSPMLYGQRSTKNASKGAIHLPGSKQVAPESLQKVVIEKLALLITGVIAETGMRYRITSTQIEALVQQLGPRLTAKVLQKAGFSLGGDGNAYRTPKDFVGEIIVPLQNFDHLRECVNEFDVDVDVDGVLRRKFRLDRRWRNFSSSNRAAARGPSERPSGVIATSEAHRPVYSGKSGPRTSTSPNVIN